MSSVTPAAAAEESKPPTVQQYLAWLDAQDDPGADQVASQFKDLSEADKEKFLGYLVDADVLKAFVETMAAPVPQTRVLEGGDVVIEVNNGAAPTGIGTRGTAGDWSCWSQFTQTLLGIDMTRLKLEQWYHSTTTKVDKVYNAAASKRNFNIGVAISSLPEEQWISAAGNALAYVTWEGKMTVSGYTAQLDKRHHIRCDETGFRYHYLKNI